MSLQPLEQGLFAYIGSDYFDTFTFWQDKAQNEAYNFDTTPTPWSQFTMLVGDIELTIDNNGLTVDFANGQVSPSIDRAATAGIRYGTRSYALSALDENSKLGFLMLGAFEWRLPSK